jgi:hypothetical protein
MQRGYYESIAALAPMDLNLGSVYLAQPDDWLPLEQIGGLQDTGDYRISELRPSLDLSYKRTRLTTNRHGMRDREYEIEKPPATRRVALLGSSIEMGTGVENDATFEAVLEQRLNAGRGGPGGQRYEVLNFANEYYDALRNLHLLEQRVLAFAPDLVLYVAHEGEIDMLLHHAEQALSRGARPRWGWVADAFAAAGVDGSEGTFRFRRRLGPRQGLDLLARAYRELGERCRERSAVPVWVFLPNISTHSGGQDVEPLFAAADGAGFRVVSLRGVYDGHTRSEITVAPWDAHPNGLGHRLVAELLHQKLREIGALGPRPADG